MTTFFGSGEGGVVRFRFITFANKIVYLAILNLNFQLKRSVIFLNISKKENNIIYFKHLLKEKNFKTLFFLVCVQIIIIIVCMCVFMYKGIIT